ncbi:smoothelin-like protein 2 isoform X1 [Symsagittifera roscoffensis]|uniref:smoothelin-like protein 2 isoform X1 n=1 Tax=Symsagittifera roscoffensis TaxID=84072 RepID=UPI00307C2258
MTHGIPVKNMTSSFSDGVAFCAIVHFYFANAFLFEDCLKMPRKERITFAFQKAEELGGLPQLIDPEDLILMGKKPDYKVMFTYMSEMYHNLKKLEEIPQIK